MASGRDQKQRPDDIWEVSHAAGRLSAYGCYLSAQHIKDDSTRMQFNRELAYYARRVVRDVEERRLSKDEGLLAIQVEKAHLASRAADIAAQTAGLAGGFSQMYGGVQACAMPLSPACIGYGVPSMAHGLNNVYENARNLYEGRNDTEGWVKQGYRKVAVALGYTEDDGKTAYLLSDLALSGAGVARLVTKPDAWRLFRYIRSDKEVALRQMSKSSLYLEISNDLVILQQLRQGSSE